MSNKPQLRKNLWTLAFESLNSEDKAQFRKYHSEKVVETVNEALQAVQAKQRTCLQKRWTLKTNSGRRIIVRDVLDKIAFWINKFKEVGDIAVQHEPTHASLPWAGVRFLLQVSINDIQTFAAIAEALETVARLISRYSIFETMYLPPVGQELTTAQSKLCEALVLLYSDCLRYLGEIAKYYERSTGERMVRSIFETPDLTSRLLETIAKKEAEVEKSAQIVQFERSDQVNVSLVANQDENRALFGSLEALLHSLEGPLLRLSDPLVLFQDTLELKERQKLLLWLSSDNYREHHKSTYKELVPDTAQWIFSKSQYQEWQLSSACSLLWLHEIPGSGKTKLASAVIQQHLDLAQKDSRSAPIAYVYCSNTKENLLMLSPVIILRNILKQLAVSQEDQKVRQSLWEEYRRRQEAANMDGLEPSPLTMEECVQMLLTLTLDCPATIIIDGLDELDGQRLDLLEALHTFISESSSILKVMIASREDTDIAQGLEDTLSISVSASENSADIGKYVQHKVSSAIISKRLLGGAVSQTLKHHIIESLLEEAGGMFLWPAMQLQYLCDRGRFKVEADIVAALKTLPPNIVSTFDHIYARIHAYEHHSRRITTRAFAWLLVAERPLSVPELITAIHVSEDDDYDGTEHTVCEPCTYWYGKC